VKPNFEATANGDLATCIETSDGKWVHKLLCFIGRVSF
jgi:hypothetical protein